MKTLKPRYPAHVIYRRTIQARFIAMHKNRAIVDTGRNEVMLLIFASIIGDKKTTGQFLTYIDREHDGIPEPMALMGFDPIVIYDTDMDELTFGDYDWSVLGGDKEQ